MNGQSRVRASAVFVGTCVFASATGWAQLTERASVTLSGVQGNGDSTLPVLSGDGRFVAFTSRATNLVPGDVNGSTSDVIVRDRFSGVNTRVDVASNGTQANGDCFAGELTPDGRFVTFDAQATNLVPGDTNNFIDAFVHDRTTGITERVTVSNTGQQGNGDSLDASISADGRFVAFTSYATNLIAGDTNIWSDIFVRDRQLGTTTRVSVASDGSEAQFGSADPEISADGRFVTFRSAAWNLVPGDNNASDDIFVHDRALGTTERVSVGLGGLESDAGSGLPAISADGRFVAFESTATNLVLGDTNAHGDVFVFDRLLAVTERVSLSSAGVEGDSYSAGPALSADGRVVAFFSHATNFAASGPAGLWDVFVHDRASGATERMNVSTAGAPGNDFAAFPALSADGRFVTFDSPATNLVANDTNGVHDAFVHDRAATGFTSECEPGTSGVSTCPCANAPAGAARGCDNSAATGGASLTASGIAYLAQDSLVFTTQGEPSAALSLVVQANASAASGVVFGQGVGCASGALVRLFTKTASAGSITAPDFGAGDPTLSARSAARGDVLVPGATRWYFVYYRDANVLGGCPAASTFNTTQTGRVTWGP